MTKIVTIIQARMGSTRLPGKVLLELAGEAALAQIVTRVRKASLCGVVVVATSVNSNDDVLETLCSEINTPCFRGSEHDVLERYYQCARAFQADVVVRVTADCPLLMPDLFDATVAAHLQEEADYVLMDSLPKGIPAETLSFQALEASRREAALPADREHVISYVVSRSDRFRQLLLSPPIPAMARPDLRLTLDTWDDYELIEHIYRHFGERIHETTLQSIVNFVDQNETLSSLAREV